MRILQRVKDGGKDSTVDAFVLIEVKSLFSVILLRFNKGSRISFHSHAFNAWSWFLKGDMVEHDIDGSTKKYAVSLKPKLTRKSKFHKVVANVPSWCFTVRGPWDDTWEEYTESNDTWT